jgi:hypothetical protein
MQQDCQLSPTRLIKLGTLQQKLCKNKKRPIRGPPFGKEAKGEGKISQGRRCPIESRPEPRHTD